MNKKAIVDNIAKKVSIEDKRLIQALKEAKKECECAREMFQLADDPNLVDYAIYVEKAANSRYSYLLRIAKEQGIKSEEKYLTLTS